MPKPSPAALLLGFVPFVGVCFAVPLWDRVTPLVLRLPFNLFYMLAWACVTPLLLLWAYRIERRR